MPIERIAVIGAGTMGRGIVETAIARGLRVIAVEVSPEQRQAAAADIAASLRRAIERGKLALADPATPLARIDWTGELEATAAAEFVIEAVPESQQLKTRLFAALDRICPPEVILASNTSSISIGRLAEVTARPRQIVGMHFFNPVPIMRPVEIVRAEATSPETIATTRSLAEQLVKQAFVVHDSPGFVVNRVLMPLINQAAWALREGVADAATIDALMRLGCNHPLGPLALADLIGLDVCLSILRVLQRGLGEATFRPCPLLEELVEAGRLGRKSGRGFFDYTLKPAP